ncbi:MAG: BREX-1 system adenine-specific DNA-methyltransferase PglX [Bacteroidaceae bacterium]|nr:BREX-1 system adenine-specific DNA-methyltransferase PglX [Bacteroidaceae bacterium]
MDTGKIKKFAIEARNVLMQGVRQRLRSLGFSENGTAQELPLEMDGGCVFMGEVQSLEFFHKWMSLYHNVQSRGIREVEEEAAYTWFNRFMAIRIMQKQGFISSVLAYESDDVRIPVIVSEARQGRIPQMDEQTYDKLLDLLNDDSKTSAQFAILIVAYCHNNPVINKCFGTISDYTELLLPVNILSDGGFVDMLNHTEYITEENFRSPELIGWLYQFYISDRKDEAFAKKGKYNPDEIAAATQIFTPNWIVKYMTQSTLAKIYYDNCGDDTIKEKFPYGVGLDNVSPDGERFHFDELEQLKCADLACGSGHILNELFDILFWLYNQEGYSRRDAITNIFCKNLLGIDLDTRAKQLAQFALLMKAAQKDESFADAHCMPRIYDMPRPFEGELSNSIREFLMGDDNTAIQELTDAIRLMDNAQTLGSIMKFNISERTRNIIMMRIEDYEQQDIVSDTVLQMLPYIRIILALTDKYAVICMNPPYMGSGRFDSVLAKYVKDNYPRSKADLFSVFMDVSIDRLANYGKYGMINMHSWMFLSSFEELRRDLLANYRINSLLHLGPRTFDELSGEVVQNAAFVISKSHDDNQTGTYFRLVDGRSCGDKESMYLKALEEHTEKVYYAGVVQNSFDSIPGSTIGYWVSDIMISTIVHHPPIGSIAEPRAGLQTSDNNRFLRLWHEVSFIKIGLNLERELALSSGYKWFPHNKGGIDRRWYGNRDYVINFYKDGQELKYWLEHNPNDPTTKSWSRNLRNYPLYFNEGVSWSAVTSKNITVRFSPVGCLFDTSGPMLFSDTHLVYYLGFLNSNVLLKYARLFAQGLSIGSGHIAKVPLIVENENIINRICKSNIDISRLDWDSHETSWDFKTNELIALKDEVFLSINGEKQNIPTLLAEVIDDYKSKWNRLFYQLHSNEEELNRQFIEIYGLQDELTPDVPLNEVTILQQGEISIENNEIVWHADVVMKQLISYAVGCMMGRYSIDKPGLILANQGDGIKEFEALVPESRFEIDDDGIIPLMSSNTEFTDCATKRFKTWLAVTFGEQHLVDNLNFIEASIGKSLDDYFVKDFWKDHKKMYQNRPIYWLFSSKKGAFQCIAYMHRMTPYTAEAIRTKYLLPHIEWLVNRQKDMVSNMMNLSTRERKELDSITAQIAECREYHDRLHVIADQQIDFDLDDGVVVNYAKFGDVLSILK